MANLLSLGFNHPEPKPKQPSLPEILQKISAQAPQLPRNTPEPLIWLISDSEPEANLSQTRTLKKTEDFNARVRDHHGELSWGDEDDDVVVCVDRASSSREGGD